MPPPAGMYKKNASDQRLMQIMITAIGDAYPDLARDPGRASAYVKAMLHVDLTDEEILKIAEYSRVASESERIHQAADQKKICSERARIASLDQFGAAMNGFNNNAEARQEELGRNAEAALGAELFSKLNASIQRQTNRELSMYDAPKLLESRNRNYKEVVELFCSYNYGEGKSPGAAGAGLRPDVSPVTRSNDLEAAGGLNALSA